jgi:hypothetical protein
MARNEDRLEDRPPSLKAAALPMLLGLAALAGFLGAGAMLVVLFAHDRLWIPWNVRTTVVFAVYLLLGIGGAWGLKRLKPWAGSGEPISPATRRTNTLFVVSGLLGVPGSLLLLYGTTSEEHPLGLFSNSPISIGIAVAVIAGWLLSTAIAWWWYFSADEHERKAYDFGSLVACGLFFTVTPAWWIAARAGLLPQPDAMILWVVIGVVTSIGWFWHRYR